MQVIIDNMYIFKTIIVRFIWLKLVVFENCSDVIKHWQDSPSTMLPLLKEFMANGLRVWIFRYILHIIFLTYSSTKCRCSKWNSSLVTYIICVLMQWGHWWKGASYFNKEIHQEVETSYQNSMAPLVPWWRGMQTISYSKTKVFLFKWHPK